MNVNLVSKFVALITIITAFSYSLPITSNHTNDDYYDEYKSNNYGNCSCGYKENKDEDKVLSFITTELLIYCNPAGSNTCQQRCEAEGYTLISLLCQEREYWITEKGLIVYKFCADTTWHITDWYRKNPICCRNGYPASCSENITTKSSPTILHDVYVSKSEKNYDILNALRFSDENKFLNDDVFEESESGDITDHTIGTTGTTFWNVPFSIVINSNITNNTFIEARDTNLKEAEEKIWNVPFSVVEESNSRGKVVEYDNIDYPTIKGTDVISGNVGDTIWNTPFFVEENNLVTEIMEDNTRIYNEPVDSIFTVTEDLDGSSSQITETYPSNIKDLIFDVSYFNITTIVPDKGTEFQGDILKLEFTDYMDVRSYKNKYETTTEGIKLLYNSTSETKLDENASST